MAMEVVESMFLQLFERCKYLEGVRPLKFTSNEQMVLKLSFNAWTGGDHSARGFEMFVQMFKNQPETQKLFEFAKGSSTAQMQNTERMLFHVTRVVNNIGLVIQNLDKPENVYPVIKELGGRHVAYGVPGNYFKYLGVAKRQLMAKAIKSWSPQHEQLWTKLFTWICDVLNDGMDAYGSK